jgi:hypothetical protein
MRRLGYSFALLVGSTITACAGGLNLSWDHCYSDQLPVSNKSFACLSTVGEETLVASFIPSTSLPGTVRLDANLEFQSTAVVELPAWLFPGACSQLALQPGSFVPGVDVNCHDWTGQGGAPVTIANYVFPAGDGRHALLSLTSSIDVPDTADMLPSREYVAFRIRIGHAVLAGSGACGGCSQPVTIALSLVRATTGRGLQSLVLPVSGTSNRVQWQAPGGPTAARNATWSAVKNLYR